MLLLSISPGSITSLCCYRSVLDFIPQCELDFFLQISLISMMYNWHCYKQRMERQLGAQAFCLRC